MKTIIVLLSLVSMWAGADEAADRGQRKAMTCVACHGPKGVSQNPLWPNLAGQKKEYLLKQLHDFREGRRQDPVMGPMAKTIPAGDLEDLAAYFSSL